MPLIMNYGDDAGYAMLFRSITPETCEMALNSAKAQDIAIIDPLIESDEILDDMWDKYNSMTKPFRRKADWITLEYFKLTNQQLYDFMKSRFMDIEGVSSAKIIDGDCGSSEDVINYYEENYVIDEDNSSDDRSSWLEFLYKTTITESEWKRTCRTDFINTAKDLIRRVKDLAKANGIEDVFDFPEDKEWPDLIKHMDEYKGGPNDKKDGIITKSLFLYTVYLKDIPNIFKRKQIIKKLGDIGNMIPKEHSRENKDAKIKFFTVIQGATCILISDYVMADNTIPPKLRKEFDEKYKNDSIKENYVPDHQKVEDIDAVLAKVPDIDLRMKDAEEYFMQTGLVMVIPAMINSLSELEDVWDAYNCMVRRHQRMADWKTTELFGLTNQELYMGLKKHMELKHGGHKRSYKISDVSHAYTNDEWMIDNYLEHAIQEDGINITTPELATSLLNVRNKADFYDRCAGDSIITSTIGKYNDINSGIPGDFINYTDLPAFTPDEMIDDGIIGGGNPEADQPAGDVVSPTLAENWFNQYRFLYDTGIMTDEFTEANLERVRTLRALYAKHHVHDEAFIKEVRSLGWNPNVDFTPQNRVIVDNFMREHYTSMVGTYDFIDISGETFITEGIGTALEASIKPIYIILIEGKAVLSKVIRKVTKSQYSHSMLSLDSSLEHCVSFGTNETHPTGGFIIENIKHKPKDAMIRVYTAFVDSKSYELIEKNVKWFQENIKRTSYSWMNLVTYLFKVPMETDHHLICSQFVDKMLKLGHIDFTKKKSSLIAPADLDKAANKSRKIYTVYKGYAGKYKQSQTDKKVHALVGKAKTFGPSAVMESNLINNSRLLYGNKGAIKHLYESGKNTMPESVKMVYENLLLPCHEVKSIPFKIDKHGDIFINNMKLINYETEYAKSHKLLMEYEKQNNVEGMKTELCKLWSYLLSIEEKLYGTHSISPSKRQNLFKVRARIISDFKKYIQVVQKSDKNFNFSEYYEDSPYSNSVYKIDGTTVKALLKAVQYI